MSRANAKSKSIQRDMLVAQGDLGWVEAHATQIVGQYEAWSNDGNKGRHYEGDGRGGQELTGPEQVMERTLAGSPDPIEQQWAAFLHAVSDAHTAAYVVRRLAQNFLHDGSPEATKLAESVAAMSHRAAGEGWCSNCSTFCSGARGRDEKTGELREDRLRGGLCQACWAYRQRTGGQRPKELWKSKRERAAGRMSA